MAIFIMSASTRTFNANDGEANQTYVCAPCDPCAALQFGAAGGLDSDDPYLAFERQTSGLCTGASFDLSITWDSFNLVKNRFLIVANSATIYDSGCVTGSGGATVTIPAGTHTVVFQVIGACADGHLDSDLWALTSVCA